MVNRFHYTHCLCGHAHNFFSFLFHIYIFASCISSMVVLLLLLFLLRAYKQTKRDNRMHTNTVGSGAEWPESFACACANRMCVYVVLCTVHVWFRPRPMWALRVRCKPNNRCSPERPNVACWKQRRLSYPFAVLETNSPRCFAIRQLLSLLHGTVRTLISIFPPVGNIAFTKNAIVGMVDIQHSDFVVRNISTEHVSTLISMLSESI